MTGVQVAQGEAGTGLVRREIGVKGLAGFRMSCDTEAVGCMVRTCGGLKEKRSPKGVALLGSVFLLE